MSARGHGSGLNDLMTTLEALRADPAMEDGVWSLSVIASSGTLADSGVRSAVSMHRTEPLTRIRATARVDAPVDMSFGRSVGLGLGLGLGLGMAVFIIFVIGLSQRRNGQAWHHVDLVPPGPRGALAALAAVATGTIAGQFTAQAGSRQSRTIAELNHRQNMGILALEEPLRRHPLSGRNNVGLGRYGYLNIEWTPVGGWKCVGESID